jgi:ABC-type antimicrobial peptide transport system permease subunit
VGSNLIGVLPGKSEKDGPPATAMGLIITTLVRDDLESIKSQGAHVVAATGYSLSIANVSWRDSDYETNIDGTSAEYMEVEGGEVQSGRFFTPAEEKGIAKVAVLGSVAKQELFGDSDAVGQNVKIKRQIFTVIGVMAPRGMVAFIDYDDQIHIPLLTAQKLINGVNHLSFIRVKVDTEANVDEALLSVENILRDRHGISDLSGDSDDFSVRSMAQAITMITTITNALKFFLIAMAGISLVVGGIGIMNIMLISVNERTREIGIRKAIGASNKNIISQFLLEAVFLTLIGGIIGIILGVLVSWLISVVMSFLKYDWSFVVSLSSVLLAVFISALVGLVFGLYPAGRASKLEPVEALSYE